jgi:hypothetical protein
MEKIVEKLKKYRILVIIAVILVAVLIIAGIMFLTKKKKPTDETPAKTNKFGYFADSDYPMNITYNGTDFLITLDGSKTPSLSWKAAVSDSAKLKVVNETEETDGNIVYSVTPRDVGYSSLRLERNNEIDGYQFTVASFDIELYAVEEDDGKLSAKLTNISQNVSDLVAPDTDSPVLIEGNRVTFFKLNDWTLYYEEPDKVPDGLFTIVVDRDENERVYVDIYMNPEVIFQEGSEYTVDVLDNGFRLQSQKLGIAKRLKCVKNNDKKWELVVVGDIDVKPDEPAGQDSTGGTDSTDATDSTD